MVTDKATHEPEALFVVGWLVGCCCLLLVGLFGFVWLVGFTHVGLVGLLFVWLVCNSKDRAWLVWSVCVDFEQLDTVAYGQFGSIGPFAWFGCLG